MESFEERLKRQPLCGAPADWRKEILSAVSEPQMLRQTATTHSESLLSALNHRLTSLLWPHPVAWGGLAAVWIFVFAVHFSIQDKAPAMAEKTSPPSPEVVAELQQQQRMFAELIGAGNAGDADRPKVFLPAPRSERVNILAA